MPSGSPGPFRCGDGARFTNHDGPFPNVEQDDGESLDAYQYRVLSIYRGRGGRDKPVTGQAVTPDQPQLTPFEVSTLDSRALRWIHRLVLGLQDKALMSESINHGVLSSDLTGSEDRRTDYQKIQRYSGCEVEDGSRCGSADPHHPHGMVDYPRQSQWLLGQRGLRTA
ncbi:hypothetical protein E4U26_004267 [Claviceps purpurea]|nr:hypothetical protein E4U26_004267 [Claviceps purpurea]